MKFWCENPAHQMITGPLVAYQASSSVLLLISLQIFQERARINTCEETAVTFIGLDRNCNVESMNHFASRINWNRGPYNQLGSRLFFKETVLMPKSTRLGRAPVLEAFGPPIFLTQEGGLFFSQTLPLPNVCALSENKKYVFKYIYIRIIVLYLCKYMQA